MNSRNDSISIFPVTGAPLRVVSIEAVTSAPSPMSVKGPVVVDVHSGELGTAQHDGMPGAKCNETQGATTSAARTHRRCHVVCVSAVVLAATWAMWPLPAPSVPDTSSANSPDTGPAIKSPEQVPFDLAAFHIPLWMMPPAPPVPVAAAPPPPPPAPVRLQLLAIIKETDGYAAMCYDPDADKVWTYREGDATTKDGRGRKVEKITATSVQFRDAGQGGGVATLALKTSPPIGGSK